MPQFCNPGDPKGGTMAQWPPLNTPLVTKCSFAYFFIFCTIVVARVFDWGGGANYKLRAMTNHKFSKEELFAGQRYRIMEDLKPWPVAGN